MSQSLLLYTESNFPSLSTNFKVAGTFFLYDLISLRIQLKVVLLALKHWVRIPFKMEDSPSALFKYLWINFSKCVSVAF